MKKIMVTAVFALALSSPIFSGTANARAVLEFFFPMLKDEPYDPTETMRAPFAEPEDQQPKSAIEGIVRQGDETDLTQPHLLDQDVINWASTTVIEALTFEDANQRTTLESIENKFTQGAVRQYQSFLEQQNVNRILGTGRYRILAFVNDVNDPVRIVNKGAVGEAFRWVVEVPVLLTYLERGQIDYEDAEPVNQQARIVVEVGRDPSTEIGLIVKVWDLASIETLEL